MIENIKVLPIKDGGNPRTEFDIRREEKGFSIHPFSEDDDGNYRFRLNVEVLNESDKIIPVLFNIDWGDKEYQDSRNHLLLSRDDEHWERFDAKIDGTLIYATIDIPPGRSFLSLNPRYEHGKFMDLLKELPKERFNIKIIGKSRRNRDIYAIEIGQKNIRPLAIICRVHPYESVSSYLVDGMLRWLAGNEEEVKRIISQNHLIFVPMPNPDGVFEGTCKLTLGGLNFESGNADSSREPEGVAVREYLLRNNPAAIFDLHGWMRDLHILLTNDTKKGKAFHSKLTSYEDLFEKSISIVYNKFPMWGGKKNLGGHIADKLGIVYIDSSWSWYDKTVEDIRKMGVVLLKAYSGIYKE
jgi:hypothetical protein